MNGNFTIDYKQIIIYNKMVVCVMDKRGVAVHHVSILISCTKDGNIFCHPNFYFFANVSRGGAVW